MFPIFCHLITYGAHYYITLQYTLSYYLITVGTVVHCQVVMFSFCCLRVLIYVNDVAKTLEYNAVH